MEIGEEGDYIPIAARHSPLTRMTPALTRLMGSDKSHFNVSLIVRDKDTNNLTETVSIG